ncbi:type IV toxin-antitoxin system AbiEi family antitoxin domain-containing protein [Vagococcus salmoninarum]|uniref:type IV toxin-antitoxin system AbiEi family antitoxin domain-containing protein n=1 Tax=Vagococcus salmoninarum TaxID=2739 RepID=UPI003F9C1D62
MLTKRVLDVFKKYKGTLPIKVAQQYGIDHETLRKAYLRGDIERPVRGIYLLKEAMLDDLFATQSIVSRGIYSHQTAVMLFNYSTYVPHYHYMTFPQGYNNSSLGQKKIKAKFANSETYLLGITSEKTWEGNLITVYDRERTVLDALGDPTYPEYELEEIIENYKQDNKKNSNNLTKYAEEMNVEYLLTRILTTDN